MVYTRRKDTALGSHRKPRVGILESPVARRGAVGVGAVALASATLLGGSNAVADDEDTPEIEEQRDRATEARERALEVQEQVDALYQQAGSATQHYNAAEEATAEQRDRADAAMEEAAAASDQVNEARRTLGTYAAAQYRAGGGGLPDTASLLLAEDFRSFFDTRHALDRLGDAQQQAVTDFTDRQAAADEQRDRATDELNELQDREAELEAEKQEVQDKLSKARELLDEMSAEEQAELDELERLEREEAERRAEQARLEREEQERAEREAREQAEREAQEEGQPEAPPPADEGGSTSQADAAIAFAEAQLGKPYVWGATGPNSFDCSGLTQAAWREAGVEIPRVTFDQVDFGTQVSRDALRPGDLVFFYADVSHVGLYIGDGMMIHAPKPGDVVKYESIDVMPWHSAIRPA
ncbi:NlpC/P60 family protein [Streptomyces sp. SBT349]|uniref:C40 family peptidase n=1 Tax=Streptomyces sp. SBT349 TaxID=1580539 RepID=UPI002D21B763|nr:NlpC/P60 family protein [Streptomyces sp. SBT349]